MPTMSSAGAGPFSAAPASSAAAAGAAAAAVVTAAAAAAAPASSVTAAAAGAAPSSAAPASASSSAAGSPVGSVFVKRAGDARARFAEVGIFETDTVTRLAKRASLELEWRTTAAYVDLFLIKPANDEHAFKTPTQAQIDTVLADEGNVLGEGIPLSRAGIASGAWVVARLSSPPAAAPSECTRAARSLLSCSPSRGAEGLAGRARDSAGVCGALTFFRPRFHSFYPLQAAAAAVAMRLQQLAVAAAVKPDRLNSAKSWADWC